MRNLLVTSKICKKIQNNRIRLFVILGAQQAIAAQAITEMDSDFYNICFNFTNISVPCMRKCLMINICSMSLLKAARYYKETYRFIKYIQKSASEFHVFIPHTFHAIANYLGFYSSAKTVNLLPDGMLNYFDARVTNKQYRNMLKKKTLVLLGGRYHCYRGNLTGMDHVNYHSHYVFSKTSLFTTAGKQRIINLPKSSFPRNSRNIFILDQPLERLDKVAADRIRKALHEYLGADNGNWIYKPHRDQSVSNIFFSKSSRSVMIDKTEIAEYIIQKFPISKVVSIGSSALITLKIMYPKLPCVSVGFNVLLEYNPDFLDIASAMVDFGIEFIDASNH
jgi:hypothetical protein